MSRISHFQRYSQRENHATNNTLLILRYFYQYSPFKLQKVLRDLLEDANLSIGLEFKQQIKENASTPDGLISQKPMCIYIETKLWDNLDFDQIRRHIEGIARADVIPALNPILIGLTKSALDEKAKEKFTALAEEKGVTFAALTFTQIAETLREYCADHEDDLISMVDDYKDYLSEEGLLGMHNRWLLVFPCGTSRNENVKFGLYYEPAVRPYKRGYGFLGVYHDKFVSHIGAIEAVALASYAGGVISYVPVDGQLTEDHKLRIGKAISETRYYNLKAEQLRFYLAHEFQTTEWRKSSPYGIWGPRAFDLSRILENYDARHSYTAKEIATALQGKQWQ